MGFSAALTGIRHPEQGCRDPVAMDGKFQYLPRLPSNLPVTGFSPFPGENDEGQTIGIAKFAKQLPFLNGIQKAIDQGGIDFLSHCQIMGSLLWR